MEAQRIREWEEYLASKGTSEEIVSSTDTTIAKGPLMASTELVNEEVLERAIPLLSLKVEDTEIELEPERNALEPIRDPPLSFIQRVARSLC